MPHASRGRAIISRHPGLCVNHEFPDNAGGWGLCPQCFCGSGSCAPVLAAAQNRVGLSTGPCFFLSTEGILYISPDVCIYCPSWLFDNLQTIFFFYHFLRCLFWILRPGAQLLDRHSPLPLEGMFIYLRERNPLAFPGLTLCWGNSPTTF